MSWGSKARQLSRTARQIWLHWEAPVISTKPTLHNAFQEAVRGLTTRGEARSRFDQATARGSAHLVNRFSASGKTRQSKASGGQKSKKRSRNSSSTDEQAPQVSLKVPKSQKQQKVQGNAKNNANGEGEIHAGEGGRSKKKRRKRKKTKSRIENDLEVEADKALKHDLIMDGEFAVEPLHEIKRKGGKGSSPGGKNGTEGGSSNQTKRKDSSTSGDSAQEPKGKQKKPAGPAPVTTAELMKHLEAELIAHPDKCEVRLHENMQSATKKVLDQTSKELGLHWQAYGSKSNFVRIISKFPLPRYRPEFDPRMLMRHKVSLSPGTRRVLELSLNTLRLKSGQDDWVSEEDIPRTIKGINGINGAYASQNGKSMESTVGIEYPTMGRTRAGVSSKKEEILNPGKYRSRKLQRSTIPEKPTEESLRIKEAQHQAMESLKGQQMMAIRQKLPSWKHKEDLLNIVARNQVVVISGETGCGKTTQLPQFILESEIEAGRGDKCNIICTQPRRISAMSVSQRVADERAESIGQSVGYQIRLDSERSGKTKLLFCTSGVLLRKLMGDPSLEGVSHIVVDEIHERGMNEDFLLIVLKSLLQKRENLRLILMSATLNAKLFSDYFGGAPATHIPGFTYPVQELFLEDALEASGYKIRIDVDNPDKRKVWYQKVKDVHENAAMLRYVPKREEFSGYSSDTFSSIKTWASCGNEKVHCGAVQSIIEHICLKEPPGGILVFMTGWDDITLLMDSLVANGVTGDPSRVQLLPLHSNLDSVNQQLIFKPPPPGIRKVVLATNIAETSITINDIVYVVNGGKAKEKTYDALNKIACLFPTWVSKASCRQRRGRAGRVKPGVCYHMFPKAMHEQCFIDHQLPEIMRTPLEQLCLQIKSLRLGGIRQFLSQAINPPSPQTIQNALTHLRAIGAMDDNENLTALGRHLSHLPVQPGIGKMILMGAILGALDPMLTIAAATTVKDPFIRPVSVRKEADQIRKNLAAGTRSDHIALIRAYDAFREIKQRGAGLKWDFCRSHFLHGQSLDQMEQMRYQFAELLCNIGFLRVDTRTTKLSSRRRSPSGRFYQEALDAAIAAHSTNSSNLELLRSVLCAGMFPSVALVMNAKSDSRKPSFSTLEDGSCRPHPCSVNGFEKFFPHRWLVYNDKVHTGGIFFRASTMVTDLSLLLLGSNIEVQEKGNFSILGGRYLFSAEPQVTRMIVDLQKELQDLLERKVEKPSLDLDSEGGTVVATVMALLSNECEPNKPKAKEPPPEDALEELDQSEMVVGMD